jgi:P-type E1-E2 ATPase
LQVLFDKTGTLTLGRLTVAAVKLWAPGGCTEEKLLRAAGSAERGSEHPIAAAIAAYAQVRGVPTVEPADFVASAGQGLQCVVDGKVVLLGNRGWVHENGLALSEVQEAQVARLEETGHTVVLTALSRDEGGGGLYLAGCLAVADALKPDAAGVIRQLQQQGNQVWMVSGDNPRTARYIAQLAGLAPEFVVAGVKPEGKLAKVRHPPTSCATPACDPHAPQPATPCVSRASPVHLPCISGAGAARRWLQDRLRGRRRQRRARACRGRRGHGSEQRHGHPKP